MGIFGLPASWVSAFFVVVTGAIMLSVITLFIYFFGGPNPLSRNAEARLEAAQNPGQLLELWRQYRRRRRLGVLAVLALMFVGLVLLAPEAAIVLAQGLLAAGSEILAAIQSSAEILAEQVGSP